jgi:hypothetical protein
VFYSRHDSTALEYQSIIATRYSKPRAGESFYYGLTLNQWFGTVLGAMGVSPNEYPGLSGGQGYPDSQISGGLGLTPTDAYPKSVWSAAGESLPWLRP